ncbi:hypothetical protein BH23GEM6_BH23GEM6_18040 [soil metagenome]
MLVGPPKRELQMNQSHPRRRVVGAGLPTVRKLLVSSLLFSVSVLGACDSGIASPIDENAPYRIQLSVARAELEQGDTSRVSAEVMSRGGVLISMPTSGAARTSSQIRWTSSDPSIADVSRSGLVLAKRGGDVTITASSGLLSSNSKVKVQPNGKRVTISPKVDTLQSVGHSLQLSVTVLNNGGKEVNDPAVTWQSLNPSVATVNGSGILTAVATGLALVTVSASSGADTAAIFVRQAAVHEPVPAMVQLTPGNATASVGSNVQFSATVKDGSGSAMTGASVVWSSSDLTVATVDSRGVATAKNGGKAMIRATADGVSGVAGLEVMDVAPAAVDGWNRVLQNTSITGDVVVPDGERWLIGANVQIAGNLRTVNGTIAMRPGSSLKLLGGDPAKYVGGGMHYTEQFANDIGIWVGGHGARGKLDISCTPKTGWNRTGQDPSWSSTDELWIAPTTAGDFSPRRWYPGQAIPRIDPRAPAAEVMNVTRDCSIEGPGHIHIHSTVPQRIEYVTLRRMGIVKPNEGPEGVTSGRYAIHLHHGGDGVRGTVIRGVASIDAGGRVFVPHGSHGITLEDVVAVNSWAEAFWWDHNRDERGRTDRSNDIVVDRMVVSGVHLPRSHTGSTSHVDGVGMAGGSNLIMRNSVVSGVRGSSISNGFHWVSAADNYGSAFWTFDKGNVAHNNQASGLRFWNNNQAPHETFDVITYRNGVGVENGAYANANFFERLTLIEDALFAQASGRGLNDSGTAGRPQSFKNVTASELRIGHIRLAAGMWQQYEDCTFQRVRLDGNQRQNWHARFYRCNVTPDMIEWPSPMIDVLEGSTVRIEHRDGRRWELAVTGGVVRVTAQ